MIFNEELFDKHSNQTAVITSENKIFKYNDLLFCAKDIKKKLESKALCFCLCENTTGSFLGYVSLVFNKLVSLLLDSNIDKILLKNLFPFMNPDIYGFQKVIFIFKIWQDNLFT